MRDTIITSQDYLHELWHWLKQSHDLWLENLAHVQEAELDHLRPVHWGETRPLFEIVAITARHHVYHAGEINQLLSIYRQEAWEEGEEVEENHLSTRGHRVVPPWKQTGADAHR